jgi:hypothetical protein
MSEKAVRVLRAGKNTKTRLRWKNTVPEHTLLSAGSGQFLPGEYPGVSDARAFGQSEVERDPSAILYIVAEDKILDVIIDQEYQRQRQKKRGLIYAVVSTAAVSVIALCISISVLPFSSTLGHGAFTAGAALLYMVLLFVSGTRNVHALIMIGILLVLTIFLAPSIQELVGPEKAPGSAPHSATGPRR